MNTKTENSKLSSAREVASALITIGLTSPSREAMAAISKSCRQKFLGSLEVCVEKRDDGTHRTTIQHILECVDERVLLKVKSLGYILTYEDLSLIGASLPTRFLSAINAACDATNPRHTEAKTFLSKYIGQRPWVTSTPTPNNNNHPVKESPHPTPEKKESTPPPPTDSLRSAHAHGANFVICFNAVVGRDGVPGVMVDAAAAPGTKSDWANAIHIMLDVREVSIILGVFRRWRKDAAFKAHGERNDKAFSIEAQGNSFFCKVTGKGTVRAVKILPEDATKISLIFLQQLLLAYKHLPANEVIENARSINIPFEDGH